MTKPSPQLVLSAAVSALAMAAFAFASPAIQASDSRAIAAIELPALTAQAGTLIR